MHVNYVTVQYVCYASQLECDKLKRYASAPGQMSEQDIDHR